MPARDVVPGVVVQYINRLLVAQLKEVCRYELTSTYGRKAVLQDTLKVRVMEYAQNPVALKYLFKKIISIAFGADDQQLTALGYAELIPLQVGEINPARNATAHTLPAVVRDTNVQAVSAVLQVLGRDQRSQSPAMASSSSTDMIATNYAKSYPFVKPIRYAVKPKIIQQYAKPPMKRCWNLDGEMRDLLRKSVDFGNRANPIETMTAQQLFNLVSQTELKEDLSVFMQPQHALYMYSASIQDQSQLEFPHQTSIYVCDQKITRRFDKIPNKPWALAPLDLTPFIQHRLDRVGDKQTDVDIHVHMGWQICARSLRFSFYLCQKFTTTNILLRLISSRRFRISKQTSLATFCPQPDNNDEDDGVVLAGDTVISLRDPLSFLPIKVPARGRHCRHIQCFDLQTYVDMNQVQPTWKCPICHASSVHSTHLPPTLLANSDDDDETKGLVVCEYVWEMVIMAEPSAAENVAIKPNGEWSLANHGGLSRYEEEEGDGSDDEQEQKKRQRLNNDPIVILDSPPPRNDNSIITID
jgi:hypothetical protein